MHSAAQVSAQVAKFPVLQPATLAAFRRNQEATISASFDRASAAATSGAAAGATAGLVPFKTSRETLDLCINIAPSAVAERRVKRLKKSVWASGHLHGMAQNGFRAAKPWFVTLTYALANAWLPAHVSSALGAFRNWCRARGYPCRYTWVAEIQPKRLERTGEAVVHYHLQQSHQSQRKTTKKPEPNHRQPHEGKTWSTPEAA